MDLHHELIAQVKELALELGRTPTRAEFEGRVKGGHNKLSKLGGYTAILQAAGLDTYDSRRGGRRIDNSVFERDLERHLESYEPREQIERKPYPTIGCLSDIHWPFHSQRVIDKFIAYVEKYKPQFVIIDGDAADFYSFAKFPRSHNVFTPREEVRLAREHNETFWKRIKEVHPEAKCFQLAGNHDVRPLKRVIEAMPVAEDWIAEMLKKQFTFEGVTTILDPREELIIGDIVVHHGYKTRIGAHRDHVNMNAITGHIHIGAVSFRSLRGGAVCWELHCGLAGDPEAKGLSYTSQRISNWTQGFGVVDELGPRFIPA